MRVLPFLFVPAIAYQLIAVIAAVRQIVRIRRHRQRPPSPSIGGVSVLKPLRGLDPNIFSAFSSQACQNYPNYEVLFGVSDENDPAVPEVRQLQALHPAAPIRLIVGQDPLPNAKVGVLACLGRHAKYPLWVVNDSDIKVTPEYLAQVVSPLADDSIGLVTCLYRAQAHNAPSAWEAIGVATDFMPSALVAQSIGVREFGLGSTLAFRAADLAQVGGFSALGIYLADDYQLAKHLVSLGKRALLSTYVVETSLGEDTWPGVWQHQLRWGRTIRTSKGAGYAGLFLTHSGVWILLALLTHCWLSGSLLLALRLASALLTGVFVLRSSLAARFFLLAPLWDLYSFTVWLASYAGNKVRWRNRVLTVDKEGRIRS